MIRRPTGSTRTDTFVPYTTLSRSAGAVGAWRVSDVVAAALFRGAAARLSGQSAVLSGAAFMMLSLMIVAVIGWQLLADQARERAVIDRRLGLALTAAMPRPARSEEHTSELQSLMRSSYAVFRLKKKKKKTHINA